MLPDCRSGLYRLMQQVRISRQAQSHAGRAFPDTATGAGILGEKAFDLQCKVAPVHRVMCRFSLFLLSVAGQAPLGDAGRQIALTEKESLQ
jgi:hypothetical protein